MGVKKKSLGNIVQYVFVFAVSIVLLVRIVLFIHQFGVNSYYSDEWLWNEVFRHAPSFWSLVTARSAEMSQGPTYVLSYVFALLTNFNAQAERWHTLVYFVLACGIFLHIARREGGISWLDVIIPVSIFSFQGYEMLIFASLASYTSVPLFLLSCLGLIYFLPWGIRRMLLETVVYVLLIYSGDGWVLVPAIIVILIIEYMRCQHHGNARWYVLGSIFCVVGCTYTLIQQFQPQACLDTYLPYPNNVQLSFIAYVMHFIGFYVFTTTSESPFIRQDILMTIYTCGYVILLVFLMWKHQSRPIYRVVFLLTMFTVSFIVANGLGRACHGLVQVTASRYTIIFIPSVIGIYLLLKQIKPAFLKYYLAFLLLSFLFYKEAKTYPFIMHDAKQTIEKKNALRVCTQNGQSLTVCADILNCDRCTSAVDQDAKQKLKSFEQFLQNRNANIYEK